jgi:N utilization substance protein A
MGSRVRNVMTELHGEKIDIVDYADDPAEFVGNALSPARVSHVSIIDPVARIAQVTVPDYQLSLAIGKEGQNARLAAKLTGWKIDIVPDTAAGGTVDLSAHGRAVPIPHACCPSGAHMRRMPGAGG